MKNAKDFTLLLAVGLISANTISCNKPTSTKKGAFSSASADGEGAEEDFDESKFNDEQRILDPEFGKKVAQPDSPSTMMTLESSEIDTRIIDVNLALNVWGVGADSTITTSLAMHYTPVITLYRHTPKGDNMVLDGEGAIIWKDDNRVIAECGFDAMVISSAVGRGSLSANPKIPFIGAGGGATVSFEKTAEDMSLISGTSNLFPVRKGETIQSIQEMCRKIFDASQKESLEKQSRTVVEKKLVMDERKGFEKVMKQALGGPKDLLKNVNGLEFNVDEVLASIKDGGKEVVGGVKDVGETVKDKGTDVIGGIGKVLGLFLNDAPEAEEEVRTNTFDLCFKINMALDNTILEEQYTDCKGGPVDASDELVKRAIEVAQEIAMTTGQYGFSASDF